MSDPYLREAVYALEIFIEQASAKLAPKCESPIEVGLLKGFVALHLLNRQFQIDGMHMHELQVLTDHEARVYLQHEVDGYRLDFAVHVTGSSRGKAREAWIGVECDGHQFHERTKDQAARDKKRDRDLVARGFRMLRFTGSEIYRSSFACAVDVHCLVQKIIADWDGE